MSTSARLRDHSDLGRLYQRQLDQGLLLGSAGKTGHVVTVEDHSVDGGLGGAVAETLGEPLPTPLKRLGVRRFRESGDAESPYAKHGLYAPGLDIALDHSI